MKWEKPDVDPALVRELSTSYKIDLLSATLLSRRGIVDPEEILFFLEDDPRFLHNPFLFEEMEDAVDRILLAASEGEKVLVYGDRDADGILSITIMVEKLRELGLDPYWDLPRGDDTYGLDMGIIDTYAEKDVSLILTLDCGTTNIEEISYAGEKGIECIVIDHHNPQDQLPPACAIINPKIPGNGYPFAGLCGCGVVSKVCWALDFAETELYKQTVCLLNIRPGNDTLIVEAVKLENLLETDRLTENLVPSMLDMTKGKLLDFLLNQQIVVYDAPVQERFLRRIFGNDVEINLLDIAPEIWKLFPGLAENSLLKMRSLSRIARYTKRVVEEIDIFIQLFISFVQKKESKLQTGITKNLELVAIATLADMMPLNNENRILVRNGLKKLGNPHCGGLKALVAKRNMLDRRLTARDIGWQLSPLINATGRMGEPQKAVQLFLSDDPEEQEKLSDEILGLNKMRKSIGAEAWERILPAAYKSLDELEGRMILVHDKSVHRGITGILASRLVRQFNVPSAVVAFTGELAIGSFRSTPGFGATNFLKRFDDILEDWGGHDKAAGFHLKIPGYESFESRLKELLPSVVLEKQAEEEILVDAELPPDYLKPEIIEVVDRFSPYGESNPPLIFLTRALKVAKVDLMGKNNRSHVRLLFDTGRYKWPAVYWNGVELCDLDLKNLSKADVIYQISRNYYQGQTNLRLTVLDMHPCQ